MYTDGSRNSINIYRVFQKWYETCTECYTNVILTCMYNVSTYLSHMSYVYCGADLLQRRVPSDFLPYWYVF
jgi:hypothetical protein